MQIRFLPAGGAVWGGRDRGFPGNAGHKAELCSLVYQTLYAR